MGTFEYGRERQRIDDADLALLREVIAVMLRDGTPFLLSLEHEGDGRDSVWVHPDVPVRFRFDGEPPTDADPLHLDLMTAYARSDQGVTIRSSQWA
jgi:hypothetical protein